MDSVYHTLQQQQMEAERKASDEKSEEHSHLQSQIEKLYQENYQLKSEVSPYMSEGCRGVTVNWVFKKYNIVKEDLICSEPYFIWLIRTNTFVQQVKIMVW